QLCDRATVVLPRQALEIDWQDFCEFNEQLDAERAAVVLDQIQIAPRDAKAACQVGLGHVRLTPERADLFAEHEPVCHARKANKSCRYFQHLHFDSTDLVSLLAFTLDLRMV